VSDAETLQHLYNKTKRQRKLSHRLSPEETAALVNEIRYERLIVGTSCRALAEKHDMDTNVIWRIGAGTMFKEIPFDDRMRGAIEALREAGKS
jgi:hypothetical protein